MLRLVGVLLQLRRPDRAFDTTVSNVRVRMRMQRDAVWTAASGRQAGAMVLESISIRSLALSL